MKEALLEIAKLIHIVNDRFPTSYNHVLVAGWTQYAERAVGRASRGDLEIQLLVLNFYLKIIAEITCSENKANPELFYKRKLDWLDDEAHELEAEVAVRRGIIPKLEDMTFDDISQDVKEVTS